MHDRLKTGSRGPELLALWCWLSVAADQRSARHFCSGSWCQHWSWRAPQTISQQTACRLKRVGARTQPCFTPFVTGNGSDTSPFSTTLAIMPSCRDRTMLINLGGQPSFDRMDQRPGLLMVSKALVRSMNKRYRSWHCSRHFTCSWRMANMFTVLLLCLNPH